jgi:hypothetical protein
MPININNCIDPNGSSEPYSLITDCCCVISCDLSNDSETQIEISDLSFSGDFVVSNIFIDGNPISFPIRIDAFGGVTFEYTICAPSDEGIGAVDLNIVDNIDGTTTFSYYFEAIAPASFLSPTSLNFGNVAVGNSSSLYIDVPDMLLCCNNFYVSTLIAPFSDTGGVTVCPGDRSQQIMVIFSPNALGTVNQDLTISINECNSLVIPLSGTGIEAPPSGGATTQKNKVDQTTRVEACSPRTVNNRCQTARTMQSAIRTNARRFGKR